MADTSPPEYASGSAQSPLPGGAPVYPVLFDEWEPEGRISLNGWLERSRFHPVLLAFIVGVFGFVLYQVVGLIFMIVYLLAAGFVQEIREGADAGALLMGTNPQMLLVGNGVGQLLGLALPAYLVTRLHTGRPAAFLRLRRPDAGLFVLSLLGLLALMPVVHWVGTFTDFVPLPEWIQDMERMQMELIERVLAQAGVLIPNLILIAVIPAICEELIFRGYLQRQFERAAGISGGILITGLVFGAFHLRPNQLLPLAILGIYLGYAAWRTGSLWSAVGVHFLNNGTAVAIAAYIASRPDVDLTTVEAMHVPLYVVVPAFILFLIIIHQMNQRARMLLRQRERAADGAGMEAHRPEA